jgi:hypothetical protein
MKKTKRVSIEFWHREVTTRVEGSEIHSEVAPPDADSAVTVCPTCGNPRMTIVARTDGDASVDPDLLQRALQQSGLQIQNAVARKPPRRTANPKPEDSAT